jgi:hypothetical protein
LGGGVFGAPEWQRVHRAGSLRAMWAVQLLCVMWARVGSGRFSASHHPGSLRKVIDYHFCVCGLAVCLLRWRASQVAVMWSQLGKAQEKNDAQLGAIATAAREQWEGLTVKAAQMHAMLAQVRRQPTAY